MYDAPIVYLTLEDVKRCGADDFAAARNDVRHALSLHAAEQCVLPAKVTITPPMRESGSGMHYIAMPAYLGGNVQMAGVKWVRAGKTDGSSPSITSLFLLVDHDSGDPVAVMDATLLTGIRTAAATMVAAEELANPHAEVFAMIGAGAQGRMHLQAMQYSLPNLKEIRIYNRTYEKARQLVDELGGGFHGRFMAVHDPEEAVRGADVVVSATTTNAPIIQEDWWKDGVFYAQVGGHECTFEAISAFDKIYVDDWRQLQQRGVQTLSVMAQQGQWSESGLHGTLGERLLGRISGRDSNREKIMFSSIGLGIMDIAISARIYRTAIAEHIGYRLPL